VCVPGGPVLPSNYLQSIVYTVTDRSVILYDPIGCIVYYWAATDEHDDDGPSNSISYLLDHLPWQFHLGHSFGYSRVQYLKLVVAEREKDMVVETVSRSG
jgi:hypothetical protein